MSVEWEHVAISSDQRRLHWHASPGQVGSTSSPAASATLSGVLPKPVLEGWERRPTRSNPSTMIPYGKLPGF